MYLVDGIVWIIRKLEMSLMRNFATFQQIKLFLGTFQMQGC
jgi:hypothetical protein